jgi:Tfp pilus assembly protein PilF
MSFRDRVVLDLTAKVLRDQTEVLGYYSWGSNDAAIKERYFNLKFVPGALAGMFVSSDGRSLKEPPPDWKLGTWEDKNGHFAGSPQSMAGDLIREGVTGIAGHVAEPYLEATIRPNILFPAYLSGFNLIESYYLAMPYLSWQTIVVGDPLCAPFRSTNLSSGEIDRGLDPATELPSFFSALRLSITSVTAFQQGGVHPDTVKLILKSESRLARQNPAGARQALEEAVSRDDRLTSPQLLLAAMYEQSGEYDKAITRYRRLLELAPDNPVVLNNLAYALAVRKNLVQEALPLAQKAYDLAKANPSVTDTLAWITHLAGDNARAAVLLEEAIKTGIKNAEVHLHSAIVNAALGRKEAAQSALQKALELDPKMADRAEVKTLQGTMKQ